MTAIIDLSLLPTYPNDFANVIGFVFLYFALCPLFYNIPLTILLHSVHWRYELFLNNFCLLHLEAMLLVEIVILTFLTLNSWFNVAGVMQATTMTGAKLEKRYSPSFHEDTNRKQSASKRKRDDVLRLVFCLIKLILLT